MIWWFIEGNPKFTSKFKNNHLSLPAYFYFQNYFTLKKFFFLFLNNLLLALAYSGSVTDFFVPRL